jgi:hypothetical protein
MMPPGDPRRALRRLLLAAAATLAVLVVAAWWWALAVLAAPAPAPGRDLTPAGSPATPVAVIDPPRWDLRLWRRIGPAPVVAPPPPPPLALKLFSIMHRDGALMAVLNPGDASGLVYAKAGDTVKGALIKTVGENAVDVEWYHELKHLTLGQ